jgi:hypothetical protein
MSIVTDQKYASMLSPYVRNFKKKNSVYNFSCPVCGDSKKVASKARGYLYQKDGRLKYKCHNCSAPSNMYHLLNAVDPNLAKEYLTDSLMEQRQHEPAVESQPVAPPTFHDSIDDDLQSLASLDSNHFALKYVRDRGIPVSFDDKLFYIDDFKTWANRVAPGTFDDKQLTHDEPRLVIPLIDRNHKIMGYQGRSFRKDHPVKYITILVDPHAIKIYGLDSINLNSTIRAFEGPLDAMFIPNSVATTGGRQDTLLEQAGIGKDRAVLIYDNEPRNKDTAEKMEKGLNAGWSVCIWPQGWMVGDVNEMIKAGHSSSEITKIIDDNTYNGLMGLAVLSSWKKI